MRQNAAGEKGIELGFDKLWQAASTLGFDLRQEGFEVFLNQSIELSARDARWSEAVAVGNLNFVEKMKSEKKGAASRSDF